MIQPRVKFPGKVKKGEVFEIKTLISHPMETGQRKNADGQAVPRMIVNKFVCRYNGEEIFSSQWAPAIAANPFLSFFAVATASGKLEFAWTDDAGTTYTHAAPIAVET